MQTSRLLAAEPTRPTPCRINVVVFVKKFAHTSIGTPVAAKEEVTLFNKVCSGTKQWAGFAVQETYTDKEVGNGR